MITFTSDLPVTDSPIINILLSLKFIEISVKYVISSLVPFLTGILSSNKTIFHSLSIFNSISIALSLLSGKVTVLNNWNINWGNSVN